jgi:hypothetical protein
MLRKLITLLAILTGLAAINAPAQARLASSDTAGIERLQAGWADRTAALVAVAAEVRFRTGSERRDREPAKPKPPVNTILIPTIQFGDRARE